MSKLVSHLLWAALALVCLAPMAAAQTRSLTVNDIVSTEAFGRASLSPDGRWAIYEKRGPYDAAPRFDLGPRSQWLTMDLWRVDMTRPGAAPERLLPGEGPGLIRGSWSSSSERLVVYRLRGDRFEVGVAAVAERSVRWTGLTPEMPMTGAAAEWASETELVLMVRPDGSLPWLLRYYDGSQAAMMEAWRATAMGQRPSRTVMQAEAGVAFAEKPVPPLVLTLLDVTTGTQRILATGALKDFSIAPNGRRLALVEGGELVPVRPETIVQMDTPTRQRLSFVDLDTGRITALEPSLDIAPHLLRWSQNGRELLVWARRDGNAWTDGALFRIGGASSISAVPRGDLLARPANGGIDTLRGVQADWMGDIPVLYARRPDSDRFDWYALEDTTPLPLTALLAAPAGRIAAVTPQSVLIFGDGALWRGDGSGLHRVTSADQSVAEVVIGDIEKPFRLKVNDAPRQDWVAALAPDGVNLGVSAAGVVSPLAQRSQTSDARVLAATRTAALVLRHEGLVETLSVRTSGAEHDIDQINTGLAQVELSGPVAVDHKDAFGRPARSWLFMPADKASTRGLVVDVYPGSVDSGAWTGPLNLTYGLRARVFAGAGFAVLSPAIPIDRADATGADFYVHSVDAAVDAALEAHPALPGDRIAVMGHSFGGYVALAIATRPSRYRSYISWAGMSEMFSQWGEFVPVTRSLAEDRHMMRNQQGWLETGQGGLNGPPWNDIQGYVDSSPYLAADRISAPVMMITADRDFVPMSQAELMFSARYRLGGKARLVTYWGEDHAVWSPANIRDLYEQIFDWLDDTLAAQSGVRPDAQDALPTSAPSLQTRRRP